MSTVGGMLNHDPDTRMSFTDVISITAEFEEKETSNSKIKDPFILIPIGSFLAPNLI